MDNGHGSWQTLLSGWLPGSVVETYVTIPTNQHRYQVIDQHPLHHVGKLEEAPTLLLCHGFPDLWYGWRYQIVEFANRGYRVICPSQLGYDGSSSPSSPAHYSYKSVAYDLNLLLNELNVYQPVIVLGHDWGGMVAWRFCDYFPSRIRAVATICTPYQVCAQPHHPVMSDEELIRKYRPNFGYQLAFQKPGFSKRLDQVGDLFLQPMHSANFRRRPKEMKPEGSEMGSWVKEGKLEGSIEKQIDLRNKGKLPRPDPEPELDYYISTFQRTGFEGALNWYKTRNINQREEVDAKLPPTFPAHIPALQCPATLDAALPLEMSIAPNVLKCFPGGNLEVKVLEGADHWCLQDEKQRDKVTTVLCDWIELVVSGKWKPSGTSMQSKL